MDSAGFFRCGPLIDLCRGPHVRHTGKVKAFAVTKVRNILLFVLSIVIFFLFFPFFFFFFEYAFDTDTNSLLSMSDIKICLPTAKVKSKNSST